MGALAGLLAACGASVTRCGPPPADAPKSPLVANEALRAAFSALPLRSEKAEKSLSDVAFLPNGEALLVSDEGTEIGFARVGGAGRVLDVLTAFPAFTSAVGGKLPKELDLEAVSVEGARVLVAGSASLKREKPSGTDDPKEKLREVKLVSGEGKPHSNYMIELQQADDGSFRLVRFWDLRRLLLAQPLLEVFADLPSKENGLDVEGVALRGDTAFVGLRGPVLRGHAVVARLGLSDSSVTLDFLALGGLGIRSMAAATGGGFWVLAGPTLDMADPFVLYRWDGEGSALAGAADARLQRLMSIAHAEGEKPEGVFEYEGALCVLFEGAEGGGPRCISQAALR
ncbi:MAG: hypothetical protein RL385_4057 [Pseudomonadota bacterium]